MKNLFMIKFAWTCRHENYGNIISFIVSPKISTGPNTLGYSLSKDKDEVIRFPENHPDALSIIRKLARINDSQWASPSYNIVEEEFDLDDFYDEYHYQGNYGKEVVFHTHRSCY